jgi:hypothetical protein
MAHQVVCEEHLKFKRKERKKGEEEQNWRAPGSSNASRAVSIGD